MYIDFDKHYTPGSPRGWNSEDGMNPNRGTTRLFFRRVLTLLESAEEYRGGASLEDENYKKGE